MFDIKFEGIQEYHLEIPEAEDSSTKPESTNSKKVVTIPANFYLKIPAKALSSISPPSAESAIVTQQGGIPIAQSRSQPISHRRGFLDLMIDGKQLKFSIPHHFLVSKIASNSPAPKPLPDKLAYKEALPQLNFETFNLYTPKGAVIIGVAHATDGHDILLVSTSRDQVKEIINAQNSSTLRWSWYYTEDLSRFLAEMFDHLKKLHHLDQVRFIGTDRRDLLNRPVEVSSVNYSEAPASTTIIFNQTLILERRNRVLATLAFPNFACFKKAFADLTEEQQIVIHDELTKYLEALPKNANGFFDETAIKKIKTYNGFVARFNDDKASLANAVCAQVRPQC